MYAVVVAAARVLRAAMSSFRAMSAPSLAGTSQLRCRRSTSRSCPAINPEGWRSHAQALQLTQLSPVETNLASGASCVADSRPDGSWQLG